MLCSVFGCNCNSSKNNGPGKIHFFRFPRRETSPDRFLKWTNFCKRKQFVPGKSSMICSKHFSNEDFNESDLLREKLMPDIKVVVRLKPRVFPTIFSTQKNISIASTTSNSNREERISRKREKEMVVELLKTSTPKKKMYMMKFLMTKMLMTIS